MKRYIKILLLLTIVSVVAHNLVPHTHHIVSKHEIATCDKLPTEIVLSDTGKTCNHTDESAACGFLVYLSVPIYNYVSDFQLMSDHFLDLFSLMAIVFACLCAISKIKWKYTFVYFLNYKSPFVGQLSALRAPPFFSFA